MLEQSRRERHGNVRDAIRSAVARQPAKDSEPSASVEQLEQSSTRRAFASRRSLILVLVVVVVVGGLVLHFGSNGSSSPALATSCTTPAVAVGAEGNSNALRYSLTGPEAGPYVVTLDAATARIQGSGVAVTPAGAVAIAIRKTLTGCKADGALPSPLTGAHELVIFRGSRIVTRTKIPG